MKNKIKDIAVLGSTGSVGKSVLDVVRNHSERFNVKAIASGSNVDVLCEQAREFTPDKVFIGDETRYKELREKLPSTIEVISGPEALDSIALDKGADIVFMAISGTAALRPLVAALKAGNTVALASKEPIVSAGSLIRKIADSNEAKILPVDSEHSAIMQCMDGRSPSEVRTLYVTGSGGPLRNTKKEDFAALTVEEVLDHPKWDMGRKITVDSATLMNKGLEVIEARWLFDIEAERIKVVIHPEAMVHSLVEFVDGTMNAGIFYPDMRFPVLRALAHPDILPSDLPRTNLSSIGSLTFEDPDRGKFPSLDLCYDTLEKGGTASAVLNAANECAVHMFLDGKIGFLDIISKVEKVVSAHDIVKDPSLDDIISAEKWATEEAIKGV